MEHTLADKWYCILDRMLVGKIKYNEKKEDLSAYV